MNEIFLRTKCVHQGHWCEPVEERAGLAVTPRINPGCEFATDLFMITHVPTGRTITEGYLLDKARAIRALTKLAPLADWAAISQPVPPWFAAQVSKILEESEQ